MPSLKRAVAELPADELRRVLYKVLRQQEGDAKEQMHALEQVLEATNAEKQRCVLAWLQDSAEDAATHPHKIYDFQDREVGVDPSHIVDVAAMRRPVFASTCITWKTR